MQGPLPPPAPKEVVNKPAYIPVSSKTPKKAFEVDSSRAAISRKQVTKIVAIAPYYRKG